MKSLKYTNLLYKSCDIENIFKPGVYKMFHISDPSKIYIGSSNAKGVYKNQNGVYSRWVQHIGLLRNKKHYCKILQEIINSNGIDGLRFEIIEICKNTFDCKKREQYYLDKFNPQLNISKSSTSPLGVRHSEETKAKHRALSKGLRAPEYVYENAMRKTYQFDLKGIVLRSFKSIQEASDLTKIDRGSINNCCLKKRRSAGGYLWGYTECVELSEKRKIVQYDLKMNKIASFDRYSEIVKALNINSSTAIRNCFNGKQKKAYGFIWIEEFTNGNAIDSK